MHRIWLIFGLLATPGMAQLSEEEAPASPDAQVEQQAEPGAEAPPEPSNEAEPAAGTQAEPVAEGEAATEPAPEAISWREIASPYDLERIEDNDAGFATALAIAKAAGSAPDRTELDQLLAALPREIEPDALPGRWECRTIRFTEQPRTFRIYGWFDCQISALSEGLLLEKLGGSELTSGYLYPESPTRMIYLGHAHGQAEPARDYDGPEGAEGDDPANRDDPGILTQRGPDRLLLAKPAPVGPPAYDFLDLRRP